MERHPHHLDTDGHPSCVFEIVPDELSHIILVVAFVVKFVLPRDGDRQTSDTHPEDIEDESVGGQESSIF